MRVSIRYFASVREALGPGESIEVESGATVGSVRIARDQRAADRADGRPGLDLDRFARTEGLAHRREIADRDLHVSNSANGR